MLDLANASLAKVDEDPAMAPLSICSCGGCEGNPNREVKTSSSDALLRERSGAKSSEQQQFRILDLSRVRIIFGGFRYWCEICEGRKWNIKKIVLVFLLNK